MTLYEFYNLHNSVHGHLFHEFKLKIFLIKNCVYYKLKVILLCSCRLSITNMYSIKQEAKKNPQRLELDLYLNVLYFTF